MKTHPITDHVPEAELTAITPEGAARWLTQRGWKNVGQATRGHWWLAPGYVETNLDAPAALLPVADLLDYAKSTAAAITDIARAVKASPRTIIAEMQADSRIAAECARMALRASKAAQPTETKDGAACTLAGVSKSETAATTTIQRD